MVLSDRDIRRELKLGRLDIEPLDEDSQIQPSSVDLRIDGGVKFYPSVEEIRVDTKQPELQSTEGTNGEIYIPPDSFCLASTKEYVNLPSDMTADVKGRSSIGRLGLHIHTAGFIDCGFDGQVTLELVNHNSNAIVIPEGTRVCQLVFDYTETPPTESYSGKYNGQTGPTESRISEDDEFSRPDLP